MIEVIEDLRALPAGSHALSLHATRAEARGHALAFLAGTPKGQSAAYWVSNARVSAYYDDALAEAEPEHVGCVGILPHGQVERAGEALRPVGEVRQFIAAHPEGVTAGGETLSETWSRRTIPDVLEYERWFQSQEMGVSRFICPYDLTRIPPDLAPQILRDLGAHHTHVALSRSSEPALRLMQLFVFATADDVPPVLRETLEWAFGAKLLAPEMGSGLLTLTDGGHRVIEEWSRTMTSTP